MRKFINKILLHFKEDALSKRKKLIHRNVEYKPLKDIRNVLLFWIAEEGEEWQKQLMQQWKGIKFDKLCFIPEGSKASPSEDTVILRSEDLGFGGKIQNHGLHTLLDKKYDLMLDLSSRTNALINYVLSRTQSGCIAGMKKEGGKADIVIIGEQNSPIEFINNLIRMLSEINKY